jgi:hypothetical protein
VAWFSKSKVEDLQVLCHKVCEEIVRVLWDFICNNNFDREVTAKRRSNAVG